MARDEKSNYYDVGGIELIDMIQAKLTKDQYIGFLLGNVLKYDLRCNWKGNFQRDIEKSLNYKTWLNDFTKENNIFTIEGNTDRIDNEIKEKLKWGKNYRITVEEI